VTKKLLMGNQAAGLSALAAGINLAAGYPGTPSTEVIETIAKNNPGDVHVEWACNEKAAMEVAAGVAYSGGRALVTCKQMGLNVASDPLVCLAYIGVKGGLVVYVADDPGPISSQTEQDTRSFARFAKVPVLDPSSPEEVYDMIGYAFELSERHATPVIVRPTTRVCHATAAMEVAEPTHHEPTGFDRGPRWVVFPRRAYEGHVDIWHRLPLISDEFSSYDMNAVYDVEGARMPPAKVGIVTGGVSDAYVTEALYDFDESYRFFHVATPYPFPERRALEFLDGLDKVIVFEELEPVIERALIYLCGKYHLDVEVCGKLTGDAKRVGENSVESASADLVAFFADLRGEELPAQEEASGSQPEQPSLPVRPPVLCAGCPHRASFYAVKRALAGTPARFSGDIGCYTLGNAQPLDMVDTCLCMGAGITIPQGMQVAEPDVKHIGFVGDSTFFASGITGVVNAYYNDSDITVIVLDNGTTAMTGQQPHPGTGQTMMDWPVPRDGASPNKVSIENVLRGIGLTCVQRVNPLDLDRAIGAVKQAVEFKGVSAVIFESPCVNTFRRSKVDFVDSALCTGCRHCINELGCPALTTREGTVTIDTSLCYGCDLCVQICPSGAIREGEAQ
jgi:indolepyruvate ferredoxin oxidoreductase alpha subunit